jgi:hypothetical protein
MQMDSSTATLGQANGMAPQAAFRVVAGGRHRDNELSHRPMRAGAEGEGKMMVL